ncbi:hypothetical protein [Synechococcus sp. CBW1108]|uniref:hypothetical protein n=1 Tax=Synechococcus sp. CBW1108 TaxID=1353147 RepID=UPI0018CD4230|nr:hypothetical protein [Synechococcus sp. CBW1108]QPN70710.1 hypothetical protein H8F27_03415 [Synechococcus sp. CBW1108]
MSFTADSPLRDEFLGALAALGGSAGNGRLREVLEWDAATYAAVKAELLSRRLIVPGRGRGGSVALADGSEAPRTRAPNGAPAPPRPPVPLSRRSAPSTTACARRPAAAPSSTTPSRAPGCCSSST